MPRGTTHTIEGTLRRTQLGYVIEMNGGGHWILDLSARKARTMKDKQVIATGTRTDFNMLEVERIALADAGRESRGFRSGSGGDIRNK